MKTNCIDNNLGRNFKLCWTLINLQYTERKVHNELLMLWFMLLFFLLLLL